MKVNWTIKGDIRVHIPLTGFSHDLPLKHVKVKISARKFGNSLWNSWDTVITDIFGCFTLTKEKDKDKRQFKIEVILEDDELAVYGDQVGGIVSKVLFNSKPILIHEDGGGVSHSASDNISFSVTFADGAPSSNGSLQGNFDAVRNASIWVIYKQVIEFMRNHGVAIEPKIRIQYPHDGVFDDNSETAFTDMSDGIIYIIRNTVRDDFDLDTIVHELMHFWMFDHCFGESKLIWQTVKNHGTHNVREDKTFVSFHEGFAEWAKNRILLDFYQITPLRLYGYDDNGLPLLRSKLMSIGATSLEEIAHREEAWVSVFNLLSVRSAHELDLNNNTNLAEVHAERIPHIENPLETCSSLNLGFTGLIKMFFKDESKGHKHFIKESEMNIEDFLTRACDMFPPIKDKKDIYKSLLDPNETVQPHDLFCKSALSFPHKRSAAKIKNQV